MQRLRKACARVAAATVLAAGSLLFLGSSALADGTQGPLCPLNSNAYQYDEPLGNYERTVHDEHNFRVHGIGYDRYGRKWVWGHSGESWWDDGWILAYHVSC